MATTGNNVFDMASKERNRNNMNARKLLDNYCEEHILNREEILKLLSLPDDDIAALIESAHALRKKYKGNKVHIQLLTNVK